MTARLPIVRGRGILFPQIRACASRMAKQEFLRLPVVSAGAEFLVMGYLKQRNILKYKAPPNDEW